MSRFGVAFKPVTLETWPMADPQIFCWVWSYVFVFIEPLCASQMDSDKDLDLDAILDSALDDFEALDRQSHVQTNPSGQSQPNQPAVTPEQFAEVLQNLGSQKLDVCYIGQPSC